MESYHENLGWTENLKICPFIQYLWNIKYHYITDWSKVLEIQVILSSYPEHFYANKSYIGDWNRFQIDVCKYCRL